MTRRFGWLGLMLAMNVVVGCSVQRDVTRSMGKEQAMQRSASERAERTAATRPRKVIVGTCVFGMWGPFPGFDQRLAELGKLVDEMAKQAKEKYGTDAHLDLAVLPEYGVTSGKKGPARDRCVPLQGKVLDYFGAKAREHQTYLVVAMELADDAAHGGCTNAAVLLDRQGKLVGIYRKVHAVADMGAKNLEGGMAPGYEVLYSSVISESSESRSATTFLMTTDGKRWRRRTRNWSPGQRNRRQRFSRRRGRCSTSITSSRAHGGTTRHCLIQRAR